MGDAAITVVTPVFNGVKHIEACIENVAGQGLDGVEHVIVDGGSTDGTLDVIRGRAERYRHIRLIEGPDKGQSDALNKGIRAASAEIIGILNCDDYYEPGVLPRVWELFQDKVPPATPRISNEFGRNIDTKSLIDRAPLRLVFGNPAELYGFREFDKDRIQGHLEKYLVGTYPALAQCFVLQKPLESAL